MRTKQLHLTHRGSPPPMRGKAHAVALLPVVLGITPAYAGKSSYWCNRCGCRQDHPRLCGEKLAEAVGLSENEGSPPPMRGKVDISAAGDVTGGITPAYAGKRQRQRTRSLLFWDHPRLCGEKLYRQRALWVQSGSPPPMRGKAWAEAKAPADERITPAYAGKSR